MEDHRSQLREGNPGEDVGGVMSDASAVGEGRSESSEHGKVILPSLNLSKPSEPPDGSPESAGVQGITYWKSQ